MNKNPKVATRKYKTKREDTLQLKSSSSKANYAADVFQLPLFVVLTYQERSWYHRSLSIWKKTGITRQSFRIDLKCKLYFYRLRRIFSWICISHHSLGNFSDLWRSKNWKMHFSVNYLSCPPCKALSQVLIVSPRWMKIKWY